MRVLIDGTTLCGKDGGVGAGIERYTWSLTEALTELAPEVEFGLLVPPELTQQRINALIGQKKNIRVLKQLGPRVPFLTRHLLTPLQMLLFRPTVAFFPSGQMPLSWRGKSVVTIHDVLIYQHPEWFPAEQRQAFSTRITVPVSIERAEKIIAVSRATEEGLHKLFPVTQQKTEVVHEGVAPQHVEHSAYTQERFPFDRDYVFFVGTIEPRKNLVNAVQAFHAFLESRPELAGSVRFIVAGKRGWLTKEVEEMVIHVNRQWQQYEQNGVIQFLGPVTEEEKWHLLTRASCLFFPSHDEGFGLPILEAMSVGTPVITSNKGALPEVGGDAAIYVEPDDLEGMVFALTQCLLVPEGVEHLRKEGLERAKTFTWKETARKTLSILKAV